MDSNYNNNENNTMEIDNDDDNIEDDYDNNDDEIIREIDIFVSSSDLNTYLLQFPTKAVYSDIPDIINAKFKPKHQKLNLDVSLSSKNGHYTQPYTSSKLSQRASLGVGIMNNGSMYVTPLSQILQMRPSFEHIPSKKDQDVDNNNNDEKNDIDEDDDDMPKKKDQEKVGLQKKESDRSQEARLKSYQYQQTQQDNEPYQKLKIFNIDSNESVVCLEQMIQSDIDISVDISVMESKTE